MNGATEATLAELLATAQAMNVNLVKLNGLVSKMNTSGNNNSSSSSSSSSNPASVAGSALSALGDTVGSVAGLIGKVLGGAISLVASAFGVLGSVISGIVGTVIDVGKALFEFSKKAMEGQARLSDFFAVFSSLPFGIGSLFSLASALTSVNERLLDFYRDLTKVGASFSGNMYDMMRSAARAHMSLGEFSKAVSANSEILATMGGNVQLGINRFTSTMNTLMDTKGPFASKILGLGLTSEEAANATMMYMRNQGTMNKRGLADSEAVSKGVVEYIQQLDGLVKITGKRREQLQKEADEVQLEETWQQFIASIDDPALAAKLQAAVLQRTTLAGKEAGNSLKLSFQGAADILTDAQGMIEVMTDGAMTKGNQLIKDMAFNSATSLEDIIRAVTKDSFQLGENVKRNREIQGKDLTAILGAQNFLGITATNQLVALTRSAKTADEVIAEFMKNQSDQAKGNAKELAIAEQKIKEFGQQLTLMWSKLLNVLQPTLMKLGYWFIGLAEKHLPLLIEAVDWGTKKISEMFVWMEGYFADLVKVYNQSGGSWWAIFQKILDDATETLSDMWTKMWPRIQPKMEQAFKDLGEYLKPLWDKLLKQLSDAINDWIGDNTIFGEASKDRKAREATEESKSFKEWMEKMRKSTDWFGDFGKYNRNLIEQHPEEAHSIYQDQVRKGSWDPSKVEVSPRDRRASGGLVNPGSYLVGENGPEVINTGMSGDVISNDNLTALLKNSNNNNVVAALERLNNTQLQLLAAMHLNNNISDSQVKATVALGNDLFA